MKSELVYDDMPEQRDAESSPPLLARYLSDVCKHSLLTREDEVRLGRQLKDARLALGRLLAKLPARCRRFVLDGAPEGPGLQREIGFAVLDTRVERLMRYAKTHDGPRLNEIAADARKHKRLMDQARDAMVQANLRLVIHIVKHYCGNGAPDLDLIQDGSVGLLRAVEKFEYEKGYKFSTYAHWWIRQAVTRALSGRSRTVHVPTHLVQTLRTIQRAFDDLGVQLDREPTREELAERSQVPIEKLDELIRTYGSPAASSL